jgi:hypothetical protein
MLFQNMKRLKEERGTVEELLPTFTKSEKESKSAVK